MGLGTNFRQKLLALGIAPLVVGQLVMLFAVMQTVETDVDQRARNSLQIGAEVVDEYLSSRSEQLKISVEVLAADFGLKEAAVTRDEETIRSVLRNHSLRVGASVAMLLDVDGRVVASTDDSVRHWQTDFASLVGDGNSQSRKIIATAGSSVYQAFVVPLRAPVTVGWIVAGFTIDQAVVERIAGLTGLGVVLVDIEHQTILASSTSLDDLGKQAESTLFSIVEPMKSVHTITHVGVEQLALGAPLLAGDDSVQLVLMRSMDEAMAPYVQARNGLWIFAFFLLSMVAMAAAWVSGGIARPLRMLTDAARKMSSGQYHAAVNVASNDEFGELASSFNAMGTAIAERESRIYHQMMHDSLTDLPNRDKIIKLLSEGIAADPGQEFSVLAVRLSRMSKISTTIGHSASDELIQLAARQLQLDLGEQDFIGHVGSSDFVIVLTGAGYDRAQANAEKVEARLKTGVMLGNVNISLQTEIGIAMYPQHGQEASQLLRNAMIARSEARSSNESLAVFEPGREQHYERQLRIVHDLRGAIQNNELVVYYQPKLALESGSVHGAEALVRWEHPEYGFLPPDEFIPAAEEAGTIQTLTRFVMGRAIADCRKWQSAGHELQVSVNVSAKDLLDDYLPYFVSQLLKEYQVPAHRLTLEVTESTVMQKVEKAVFVLECLRDIGVRISMDDFGTGQSSLAQLKNIPVQELKIDKSFIMTLCSDSQNQAIVRTTLQLAENMGLDVVAEGVEDSQTMQYLAQTGCQQAQGYHISKPISSPDFMQWLENRAKVPKIDRRGAARPFTDKVS
jgi:diguanylate cyclase (GGDEF)-like protein